MSRNGSGVYSLPSGSTITNGDVTDATDINSPLADIEADLNVARPIVAGGTGATSAAAALVNLGLTATAAEINVLDGVTASTAELNKLDGVTATATELNYVAGVTSAIQTQLNAKQASGATLTSLEGLSLAQGDILYATAADTLQRLPKGTAGQALQMNSGATAPEWGTGGSFIHSWHPYDMVAPTDGAIGRIYNGTVVASVAVPTMEAGWDYAFRGQAISHNNGASQTFQINGVANGAVSIIAAATTMNFWMELPAPAAANFPKAATIFIGNAGSNLVAVPATSYFTNNATALTTFNFTWSAGSFDAGQIFMYRRRNYMPA